jgi:hypothetical protein
MAIKKTELEKIVRHLRNILEVLEAEIAPIEIPPDVQAEVQRKIEARTCLAWDHQIPDGQKVRRGLCETDYSTTMARIRRGETTEEEMMRSGELGPVGKPGRIAARDAAREQKMQVVKDDLEAFKAKRKKRKDANG